MADIWREFEGMAHLKEEGNGGLKIYLVMVHPARWIKRFPPMTSAPGEHSPVRSSRGVIFFPRFCDGLSQLVIAPCHSLS